MIEAQEPHLFQVLDYLWLPDSVMYLDVYVYGQCDIMVTLCVFHFIWLCIIIIIIIMLIMYVLFLWKLWCKSFL